MAIPVPDFKDWLKYLYVVDSSVLKGKMYFLSKDSIYEVSNIKPPDPSPEEAVGNNPIRRNIILE